MKKAKIISIVIIAILIMILLLPNVFARSRTPAGIRYTDKDRDIELPLQNARMSEDGKFSFEYYRELFNEYYNLYCADHVDDAKGTYSADLKIVLNGEQTDIYSYTDNTLLYSGKLELSNKIAKILYLDDLQAPLGEEFHEAHKNKTRDPETVIRNDKGEEIDFCGVISYRYIQADKPFERWYSAGQVLMWKYIQPWYNELITSTGFTSVENKEKVKNIIDATHSEKADEVNEVLYKMTGGKVDLQDLRNKYNKTELDFTDITKYYEEQFNNYGNSSTNYSVTMYYMRHDQSTASQEVIIVEPPKKSETVDIPVKKTWDDDNNRDGQRPLEITVTLYENENPTTKTVKLNESNKWYAEFTGLPKYKDGELIKYTVKENVPPGYNSSTSGNESSGYTITNKHTPVRINIPVTKVWDDQDNIDELRTSITVELYADGKATGNKLTLSESNNWKGTFTNLYKYANGKEIVYTVKESGVPTGYTITQSGDKTNGFTITNKHVPHYDGYIEISGKVWMDGKAGKGNTINGKLEDGESGIPGIKVTLRQENGQVFDSKNPSAYTVTTANDGTYTIKVNYDNSQNVYKLYENSTTVAERLKKAYVEFEYDGLKYTTVATATTGVDTSKAKENETSRNTLDSAHKTITPSTQTPDNWTDKNITAVTQGVISFESYTDRKTETSTEVIKYCDGHGNYEHTNSNNAWENILKGKFTCENCTGQGHTVRTFDVNVDKIQNVNLGLFEREQPEVSIISDISKVEVTMNNQKYTYLYGKRAFVEESDLKINYQNKDNNEFKYERPLNPADIAYVNDVDNNAMSVLVTYKVNVANLSSTLPVTVHSIINAYDKEYTIVSIVQNGETIGYTKTETYGTETATGFKEITLNKDIKLAPYTQSDNIEITYSISLNAIIGLLQQNATLDNAVEIQSYSTEYGESTLYAEQRTGGRTGNAYAGYDYEAHPGNAGIYINRDDNRLKANKPERDTDIAPSFVLYKDDEKMLSGNVWEDSDANTTDDLRLGDGKKSEGEKNLANAKIELLKVKDDGTLEPAYLYNSDPNKEKILAVTYSDENGNYSFGNNDNGYSVVTDRYVMKFTYGEEITKEDGTKISSTIDGANVNARNYKSTIISSDDNAKALYDVIKGTSSDENWHLKINKGYSIAVDEMEQRVAINDLQYSNFGDAINIEAYSKPFKMQVEFDPNGESPVGENGKTTFGNNLDVFDFGIIERAREDIYVDKTVSYLKVILANGQVLTEGNPYEQTLSYVKTMGFKQNINNGSEAGGALDKQMLIEMDSELIQGAQIEVKYQVKVINNSEKDFDYYLGDTAGEYDSSKVRTEYYYFGTNNEGSPVITSSVNYLVDYVGADIANGYTWENSDRWEKVTADSLREAGKELICGAASDTIKSNDYVAYVTTQYSELAPGETSTPEYATAKKLLANQDENVLENHLEILQIDAKSARTIKEKGITKEYKPGDYVPSLEARTIKTGFEEKAGLHEQDDDRVKVMITNATGVTNYITTYVITGAIGLIVIAVGIVFIKKKVLKK